MTDRIKTINIVHPDGYSVINEEDFIDGAHELYDGKDQENENSVAHNSKGRDITKYNTDKVKGTTAGKRGKGRGKGKKVHVEAVAEDEENPIADDGNQES